jgi:hypothetical protein
VGGRRMEPRLRRVNAGRWRLAPVGSSDAHHLAQIGTARTRFAGRTPEALREALATGATEARWGPEGTVTLRQHARQGWVSLVLKPARELRAAVAPRKAPSAPAAYEADATAAGTPSEAGAPPAEAPSKGAAETEEMVAPPRTTSPS